MAAASCSHQYSPALLLVSHGELLIMGSWGVSHIVTTVPLAAWLGITAPGVRKEQQQTVPSDVLPTWQCTVEGLCSQLDQPDIVSSLR
jgi:hypothetical protein